MTHFGRRDVLRTAAALPLAAVAGCTNPLADDAAPPGYASSIPRAHASEETDVEGSFFVHLEWERLKSFQHSEEPDYVDELPNAVDLSLDGDRTTPPVDVDPLLAYPVGGLFVGVFTVGVGLIPFGFADTLLGNVGDEYVGDRATTSTPTPEGGAAEEDNGTASASVDSILLVDGVGVFEGSIDARAIVAASSGFEPAGEHGDFDVYEGTGEGFLDTDGLAFAVRDDTLVVGFHRDADVEPVLEAIGGDGDRLVDDADGEWALTTGGHGHVTLGAWGVDPQDPVGDREFGPDRELVDVESVFDDADVVVSSLELGSTRASAATAAAFPEGAAPSEADVGAEVGTSATERDVAVEGDRVTVTGEWYVESEETATDSP